MRCAPVGDPVRGSAVDWDLAALFATTDLAPLDILAGMVAFTVYLADDGVPQGLAYGRGAGYSISAAGVLRVEDAGHVPVHNFPVDCNTLRYLRFPPPWKTLNMVR